MSTTSRLNSEMVRSAAEKVLARATSPKSAGTSRRASTSVLRKPMAWTPSRLMTVHQVPCAIWRPMLPPPPAGGASAGLCASMLLMAGTGQPVIAAAPRPVGDLVQAGRQALPKLASNVGRQVERQDGADRRREP